MLKSLQLNSSIVEIMNLCLTLMKNINSGRSLLGQFRAGFNEVQTAKLCQPQINEKSLKQWRSLYLHIDCFPCLYLPVSTYFYLFQPVCNKNQRSRWILQTIFPKKGFAKELSCKRFPSWPDCDFLLNVVLQGLFTCFFLLWRWGLASKLSAT